MEYASTLHSYVQHLFQWQTLIAGVLALIAAIWTIFQINKQIRQTEKLETDKRYSENNAARAVLPLALSQLTQYCREAIQFLDARRIGVIGARIPPEIQLPRIEDDIVAILRESVRFADGDKVKQLSTVLAMLQILSSRLEGVVEGRTGRTVSDISARDNILYAADIHSKIDALYEYGREGADLNDRASTDELRKALRSAGIYSDDHPTHQHLRDIEQRAEKPSR
ncbi:MAG: hypothetical protein AB7F51_02830 [Pseudorhodoplanes sp.]